MPRMLILPVIFLAIFASVVKAHSRKLSTAINPGCPFPECQWKNESSPLLVHVRADGNEDTLHHVWDFTGSPSLLLVHTARECELNVTWDKYVKSNGTSVTFSTEPIYTFGVILDRVFEFNDEHNSGIFDIYNRNESYVHIMDVKDFRWKLGQSVFNDSETALLSLVGKRHDSKTNTTGVIRITMGAYGGVEHASASPHLLHSSNSSQMDITLENMPTSFEKSRYGISLVTISSDPSNSTMVLNVKKTLDDEHDPGVFSIVEVTSPEARSPTDNVDLVKGGYIQWRPIVFTSELRDVTNSSDSVQYDITPLNELDRLEKTLFYKLFSDKLHDHLISTTNVTFGAAGDKYYKKTNFSSWTFVAGIGRPMEEQFSKWVIMILVIGLGLPIVLIVFGVLCVVTRRILKNKDDLFLSQ